MRRLVVSVVLASGLVMIGAGSASAEPAPSAASVKAVAGKKVCKVTDPVLDELSGIVATKDGFVVINDSASDDSHRRVFFLNDSCKITDRVSFTGTPRDTEDLILSPDGDTLWIADIGDNNRERPTISVWTMPADGSARPKIHRFSYPEGDKHDAEAMLLNGDGTPIVITKEIGRAAGVYVPTGAMKTNNDTGVPLKRVGEITVPPSTTAGNGLARIGRGTIDGGAVAPDGGKVALRTYTDALEWNVTGGDVLAAIKGKPRVTPLPDEPQGEAITYSTDGKAFITVSDMQGNTDAADNYLLRYTPASAVVVAKTDVAPKSPSGGPAWYSSLSLNDITYFVGGVGVLGAILVGIGIFGITRSRKRRPGAPAGRGTGPAGPKPPAELIGAAPSGRGGRSGATPGGRPGQAPSGGVYGGQPGQARPQRGSGVYGAPSGGRPASGGRSAPRSSGSGVYGAKPVPPPPPPGGRGGRAGGGRGGSGRGGDQRPSGYSGGGSNTYGSDPTRDYDNPGYGRGR